MCIAPKYIRNNSTDGDVTSPRYRRLVPCGVCHECLQAQRNEWFVRTNQQIQDTINSNGLVIFCTLTYNEKDLPFIKVHDGSKIIGFSQGHIQKFLSDIRNSYRDVSGNRSENPAKGIKYLIASEYGEKTHRPHYHMLLFIPSSLLQFYKSPLQFLQEARIKLKNFWKHGYLFFSANKKGFNMHTSGILANVGTSYMRTIRSSNGKYVRYNFVDMCVSSEAAARYVSKYCCKEVGFYKEPCVHKFLNPTLSDLKDYNTIEDKHFTLLDSLVKVRKKQLDPIKPRHWQSRGFGMSLVADIAMKSYEDKLDSLVNGIPFINYKTGQKVFYSVPRYFRNKLIHEEDDYGVILNDLGLDWKRKSFEKMYEHNTQSIFSVFNYDSVRYLPSDLLVSYGYESLQMFFLNNAFVDQKKLVLYNMLWDSLGVHVDYKSQFENFLVTKDLYDVTESFYINDAFVYSGRPDKDKFIDNVSLFDFVKCKDLSYFDNMDHLSKCIQVLINALRLNIYKCRQPKIDAVNSVKNMFYHKIVV